MASTMTEHLLLAKEGYNSSGLPILDLRFGGQWGYAPNLSEIENATAYVPHDLSIVVVRHPRMFDYLLKPEIWIDGLRSLISTHAYSIEGFNHSLTLTTSDYEVGAGGEMMKAPVDAKRTPTELTFNFRELEGQPISRFLEAWIRIGIWDPDTNHPMITTMELGKALPDTWLLSEYSMTILAFEPDTHFKNVQRSWVVTGCFPLSSGEVTGARSPAQAKSLREMSIQFSGIAESNEGTRLWAQTILEKLNVKGATPYNTKSFLTDTDVTYVENGKAGYFDSVKYHRDNQVPAKKTAPPPPPI